MKRIISVVAAAALVAGVAAVGASAKADPALLPTSHMVVATHVGELVAAEQVRIAEAEAARNAWENDMTGIGPSAYTGSFYVAGSDATRQCIVRKESTGNYAVVSSNGLYHGAYQFMQATANTAATKMGRPDLVGVPPEQWNRMEQDMAFWVTWNYGAGRGNWPTARGC